MVETKNIKKVCVGILAKLVKGRIVKGKPSTPIRDFSSVEDAKPGDIVFLTNKKYSPLVATTKASAILLNSEELPIVRSFPPNLAVISVANADLAFGEVIDFFKPPKQKLAPKISPNTDIAGDAKIGYNVSVESFSTIGNNCAIGSGTIIYPHVYVGDSVKIGLNCTIYPHVTILHDSVIGDNVVIHSGAVIGSNGFGFTLSDGHRIRIPQRGNVDIGSNVEIGANVTIDRARFGSTKVGMHVKIDNLVHIAHNVQIGDNSVIIAGTVIAGSAKIGRNVVLAGHSGIAGHITVGDNVQVGAKSGVMKDIPPNTIVAGFPARPYREHLREKAILRKLPQYIKQLKLD